MANLPSSSSPQSLSSASNSDNSPATTTKPTSHSSLSPKLQVDAGENNFDEKTPEVATNFQYLYLANHIEKFKIYEADYARRLMAKYFSKKNLYGGNVFDENVTIDNELIKSSRWPCTRSYADSVKAFEDQNSSESVTVNETPSNISNGKHLPKKNG
ncbi:hypothetical protein L484_022933 [Morus notabilis]|uniref:Uncharacterized protein n=2 Tax=Morus notabilis TaxID=981085 RepID=W9R1D8_9ROSA|nr:hypothetical protein L484_022933 [Morus notabilis]